MTKNWGVEQAIQTLPNWVPPYARHYIEHKVKGVSIRSLARQSNVHASTVLRQIRRIETRRNDPLIDEALSVLGVQVSIRTASSQQTETLDMNALNTALLPSEETLATAAGEILLKLSDAGAILAVSEDAEKAVVVRDMPDGTVKTTAVVDRSIAQAMALKNWISCKSPSKICRYVLTSGGRAALEQLHNAALDPIAGFEETQEGFDPEPIKAKRVRFGGHESPVAVLARRRDKDGNPFLSREQVAAGERLREDFELAQMDTGGTQNWSHFLTAGVQVSRHSPEHTPRSANSRLEAALAALGDGLADVVVRCCCYMEGMEVAEKRLGWPARSGKVVLRIALTRLCEHYRTTRSDMSDMIG